MNELIDQNLLSLMEGLYNSISVLFGEFVSDAQALAAIFALCYFAIESYKLMLGDKRLELLPLLRPFAFFLILIMWIPFVNIISYPSQVITKHSKAMFTDQIKEVELLSKERFVLADSVAVELLTTSLEVERAEKESDSSFWDEFGIGLDWIKDKISGLWIFIQARLMYLQQQIIQYLTVTFWQFCVYLVFFLQIIFMGVLVILGPLSFAISILHGFRDTYLQWIARFISVSLYVAIAYIVLSISLVLMGYALNKEIDVLHQVLSDQTAFIMYTTKTSAAENAFSLVCLVGGVGMLTVPFISTWIVHTTGVGQAVGAAVGGATAAAKIV